MLISACQNQKFWWAESWKLVFSGVNKLPELANQYGLSNQFLLRVEQSMMICIVSMGNIAQFLVVNDTHFLTVNL